MKFFHVLRNSPNWLAIGEDYESHEFNPLVKQSLLKVIKDWNRIFVPDYFTFRHKIAEVACKNFDKLSVDHRWPSATHIEDSLKSESAPFVVAFTDDDDWHHKDLPNTAMAAYEKNPDVDAIIWRHSAFCTNYKMFDAHGFGRRVEPYFIINDELFFHTNNYVLTDNFFRKLTDEDIHLLHEGKSWDLHYGHTNLDHFMKSKIKIIQLPQILSMASKSITSYSYFWDYGVSDLVDVVKKCQTCVVKIPKELTWATEEINKTMDLYKTMNVKPQRILL